MSEMAAEIQQQQEVQQGVTHSFGARVEDSLGNNSTGWGAILLLGFQGRI